MGRSPAQVTASPTLSHVRMPFYCKQYGIQSKMTSTQIDKQPSILDLPDHLLNDIGSLLDEKHSCNMEIASKVFYTVLSKPSSDSMGLLQIEALLRLKEQSRMEASRYSADEQPDALNPSIVCQNHYCTKRAFAWQVAREENDEIPPYRV